MRVGGRTGVYAAPEAPVGKDVVVLKSNPGAYDIFALGLVGWELVSGKGDWWRRVGEVGDWESGWRPWNARRGGGGEGGEYEGVEGGDVDEEVLDILVHCCDRYLPDRWTAEEVAEKLKAVIERLRREQSGAVEEEKEEEEEEEEEVVIARDLSDHAQSSVRETSELGEKSSSPPGGQSQSESAEHSGSPSASARHEETADSSSVRMGITPNW